MPVHDPDARYTIVVLTSKTIHAAAALRLEHNAEFVPSATFTLDADEDTDGGTGGCSPSSREPTPIVEEPLAVDLTLTLHDKPFDPLKGYVFGSDADSCDVLLSMRLSREGISRRHFQIDYDWENGSLMLTDVSSVFTVVHSKPFGRQFLQKQSIPIHTGDTIQVALIQLEVFIPERGSHKADFDRLWQRCRAERDAALPRIGNLIFKELKTQTVLDSKRVGCLQRIGSGTSADVYQAVDCKGDIFAVKIFRAHTLLSRKKYVDSEIRISNTIRHDHMITIFADKRLDTSRPPQSYLVMELCRAGTLSSRGLLNVNETTTVFEQLCQVVAYIHANGLAHRDIKPDNILLQSWDPIHIKLADFGLARAQDLLTFCGTSAYVAPEVCYTVAVVSPDHPDKNPSKTPSSATTAGKGPYSTKVDMWSIGVMYLSYIRRGLLPRVSDLPGLRAYHAALVECAGQPILTPSPWQDHSRIAQGLLRVDPATRLSASACLDAIRKLRRRRRPSTDDDDGERGEAAAAVGVERTSSSSSPPSSRSRSPVRKKRKKAIDE